MYERSLTHGPLNLECVVDMLVNALLGAPVGALPGAPVDVLVEVKRAQCTRSGTGPLREPA